MPDSSFSSASFWDDRLKVLSFLAFLAYLTLLSRLFHLQIARGAELAHLAELNRTQIIPLRAPRGFLLDRQGDILVYNVPSFSLFYSAQSVPEEAELKVKKELAAIFEKWSSVIQRKIFEARRTGKMVRVIPDVPRETAFALLEKRMDLPGVSVLEEPKRQARYGALASHVLGYVDEVTAKDLKRLGETYRAGQLIGKTGLERHYDTSLRGVDGGLQFEMDHVGRHMKILQRIPSLSGADVTLTLDRGMQQVLEEALRDMPSPRGAAVALDPRTGAVLAMASKPGFDVTQGLAEYLEDRNLPFFNRAIQGGYPPGSVFKIITAASALQDFNWNIRQNILCKGSFTLGNKIFKCWETRGHGWKDFRGAMAWSCNIYFFNMGLRAGIDSIDRMARAFGLGAKTGLDVPGESAGLVPSPEWKRRVQKAPWLGGDTVNVSIGQGSTAVTPLQIAVMMAAVATGGTVWRPYLVSAIKSTDGRTLYEGAPAVVSRVNLSPDVWKILWGCLEGVVRDGTARGIYRDDIKVSGKTGTAQNPHGDDHAWFACYAAKPGEMPSLVVSVLAENGGHGATAAAPVAQRVIDHVFPKEPS